jgi:small-conductance mechanosensitive channel
MNQGLKFDGNNFLNGMLYFNTIQDYLICVGIVVLGMIILKLLQKFTMLRLSRAGRPLTAYLFGINRFIYPILFVLLFYVAFHWLTVTPKVSSFADQVFKVVFIFLIIRLIAGSVKNAIFSYLSNQDETGSKLKQVRGIVLVLTIVLWIIGIIFLFDNLGFNVTAVLTGLGVGGIAIALAAQTILGDIFNYFVIFFDRPFEVGDFIIVDDKMGTVEYIGLKTTRIKSLSGEQIIFSNSNLTNSRVHNYKRMSDRRILFRFGVLYGTGKEKLSLIPQLIKKAINALPGTRFDRAHFSSFGTYSLDFEVVYYILSAEYNNYMDTQQQINLDLYEAFEREGIEFAVPTYSVKVNALNESTSFFSHEQN